jgi:hypothetical protein
MPTYYVEYDGKRAADAVDPAPAETDAAPVEDWSDKATAKVVEAPQKDAAKKTSKAQTK